MVIVRGCTAHILLESNSALDALASGLNLFELVGSLKVCEKRAERHYAAEKNPEFQAIYESCRMLFKYAWTCGGNSVDGVEVDETGIMFDINFDSTNQCDAFSNKVTEIVQ